MWGRELEAPWDDSVIREVEPLAEVVCVIVPIGVVTVMVLKSNGSAEMSILYPGGRKVLKPCMRYGFPVKSVETRSMTPGVSILKRREVSLIPCT